MAATPRNVGPADIRWFEARYDGSCNNCGEFFLAGDIVGYDEDTLIGQDCCGSPRDDDRKADRDKPCIRCFEIHRGECM